MTEALLNKNYKDISATIIVKALENTLRKLYQRGNIATEKEHADEKGETLTKNLSINPMSTALSKKDIIQSLSKKQITSFANIRNNAIHGKYNPYTKDHVKTMFLFVQKFCIKYFQ